jgi:hypothetical protein
MIDTQEEEEEENEKKKTFLLLIKNLNLILCQRKVRALIQLLYRL